MYCKSCLSIVISQFSKCSSCSCDYKNNYRKLKEKNKLVGIVSGVASANSRSVDFNSANYNILDYNDIDDLDDYEMAQLAYLTIQEEQTINKSNNFKNQSNFSNITSNTTNKRNNADNISNNTSNNKLNKAINNYDQKIIIKNGSMNYYTITNQRDISTLIYTANNMNLYPIVLNYKLLDNEFQSILDIYLKKLLDKPNKFNTIWDQYALLINNFCNNFSERNINQLVKSVDFINDKKELIKKIIDLN
jgi:hypothetical protein